jgi:hypothetical protein
MGGFVAETSTAKHNLCVRDGADTARSIDRAFQDDASQLIDAERGSTVIRARRCCALAA